MPFRDIAPERFHLGAAVDERDWGRVLREALSRKRPDADVLHRRVVERFGRTVFQRAVVGGILGRLGSMQTEFGSTGPTQHR